MAPINEANKFSNTLVIDRVGINRFFDARNISINMDSGKIRIVNEDGSVKDFVQFACKEIVVNLKRE